MHMAFGPFVLRVLLSISLILNGSGYALAGTHGHGGHGNHGVNAAGSAVVDAEPVADAQPPCHQHEEVDAGQAADLQSDALQGGTVTGTDEAPADCCKNGACRCGCVHQTQVAVPTFFLRSPAVAPPQAVPELQNRHAEPALPHLMRPPIV